MNSIAMLRMTALALTTIGASLLGGVGLGGYTIGGFRVHAPPPDMLRELAGGDEAVDDQWPQPAPVAISYTTGKHVCTGCDAKLYRDDWGYSEYEPYDPDGNTDYYADASDEAVPAWDEVHPAVSTVNGASRRDIRGDAASTHSDVDWAAVMAAYDVTLPVVARAAPAQPEPAKASQRASPAKTAPVVVAAYEAPVATAKLEAPAVVSGMRSQ